MMGIWDAKIQGTATIYCPRRANKWTRGRLAVADFRAGTTLVEMLAYVAILAVVINLALSLFLSASRLSMLGTSGLDKMVVLETMREDFTETVREAVAVTERVAAYRADEDTLVLELPSEPGEGRRFAVFGMMGAEPRLSRLVLIEKDGAFAAERLDTYRLDLEQAGFTLDAADPAQARRASLHVVLKTDRERKTPSTGNTFWAAMRSVASDRAGGQQR